MTCRCDRPPKKARAGSGRGVDFARFRPVARKYDRAWTSAGHGPPRRTQEGGTRRCAGTAQRRANPHGPRAKTTLTREKVSPAKWVLLRIDQDGRPDALSPGLPLLPRRDDRPFTADR